MLHCRISSVFSAMQHKQRKSGLLSDFTMKNSLKNGKIHQVSRLEGKKMLRRVIS